MSDLRKAAELALEALEQTPTVNKLFDSESYEKQKHAIDALRQALAQPEQEPVVGMFEEKLPDQNPPPWSRSYRLKREWVGITYDEVYEFVCTTDSYINFARAIEAKLKERNGG